MDQLVASLSDIALPSVFAGIVAVLATVAVERLGGTLGGVLSSIPTTIVPAAIGLSGGSLGGSMAAADVDDFRRAMAFVPVGILLNAGYLVLWRVIPARLGPRHRTHLLAVTTLGALGAWFVAAAAIMTLHELAQPSLAHALAAGILAFLAGITLGVAANRTAHSAPKGTRRVGAGVLVLRGVAAAGVIGGAILLKRSGLPVASGIAAVFPVIFTTIMIATWLAQGAQVPTGSVGPMALGTLSVSAFALLAAWLYPIMPIAPATAIAWTLSIAFVSIPAYLFLRARRAAHRAASRAASQGPNQGARTA